MLLNPTDVRSSGRGLFSTLLIVALTAFVQAGCGGSRAPRGNDLADSIRSAESEKILKELGDLEKNSQYVFRNGKLIDKEKGGEGYCPH